MAARAFLHDERMARPAILAAVILAHLAALLIPLIERPQQRYRTFNGPGHEARLILEEPKPLRSPPPEVSSWKLSIAPPPQPELATHSLPNEAASAASSLAAPDWRQSGAEAAADAARKEYRALGPSTQEPKKTPRSPFKPPPKHKAGEIGEDALENPVLWLSENCYLRFENRRAPPGDPFAQIPMTLCVFPVGKLEPKGDLFDHLRKPRPVP